MIAIAREEAAREGLDVVFEAGDYEQLDLGRRFDACLIYDALHHSERPELVLAAAHRALKPGGRILVAEPNWKQRYQGRGASDTYGTTELGYSPRRLKRLLREAGFTEVRRFHNNRKRLFSNSPADTAAHLAEPLTYRLLAPFWTQIWLRPVRPAVRSSPVVSGFSWSSSTARSSAGIARPKSCWPCSKLPSSNHGRQFSGCSPTASMYSCRAPWESPSCSAPRPGRAAGRARAG